MHILEKAFYGGKPGHIIYSFHRATHSILCACSSFPAVACATEIALSPRARASLCRDQAMATGLGPQMLSRTWHILSGRAIDLPLAALIACGMCR